MLFCIVFFGVGAIMFALPELSSDGQLQGGLRIPEVDWLPIAMGWDRLRNMPLIGMPEGKWDQLIGLCVLGVIFGKRKWYVRIPPAVISIVILVVTAFILEDRLGTRLLVPASFGVLILLPSLFQRWPKLIAIVVVGLFLDFWAFVDQFQERRTAWAQSDALSIPSAPALWRSQYLENQTIFKGLSLYGAARAKEIIAQSNARVFSMRLRDGRENSLFVYAHGAGNSSQTLDLQVCCSSGAGCAQRIVSSIAAKGGMIIVPTEIEGWERVHRNERRWNRELLTALRAQPSVNEEKNWVWLDGRQTSSTVAWPCTRKNRR